MNIVMMTNTYLPHVGGVARSVDAFTRAYRKRGHRVLVVAPVFPDTPEEEDDVVRLPAIQNFNGSDFSVMLPIPGYLDSVLDRFRPEIVHSHHPFLLGTTALRAASLHGCPVVFTHHTMYEQYTHYVPGDSPALRRFVIELSTSYANLCDRVFAPSESIAEVLKRRGVRVPVEALPTGVVLEQFSRGDGADWRRRLGIPQEAFVIGHVGRLAPEKNLVFLARAVARAMGGRRDVHFLVVGAGPSANEMRRVFDAAGLADRLYLPGVLSLPELADAYHAMDVFAFASLSETQGMVLAEAMAAALPVVAVDAPGVREVVTDAYNGYLLPTVDEAAFAAALCNVMALDRQQRMAWTEAVANTARRYSLERSVDAALRAYRVLEANQAARSPAAREPWYANIRRIKAEWELLKGVAQAAGAAAAGRDEHREDAL
ncbi:glycosyltransferase [Nitrococcus mobilis]|uniref:Glycosyltransferase n=1 Tax=Nitrococcus mobilis Nb-231 TaxID=314278 RepID=A4BLG7_9GAMM|nr:glycosyltransferase [Nitrococcus mobilis]EAR23155.1 Glycosyltransferase [Nitrococcus mobilis Nb-231]